MKDNRSDKVKEICLKFSAASEGCNKCPLQNPCRTKAGDTKETFDIRMNLAADDLEKGDE